MQYPFSVRDIRISDPFILADPVTRKYYTYAARFNVERYPDLKFPGCFYALESEDLIHWSDPVKVFDSEETGFWAKLDYWAPECHIWKGNYYLISSFRSPGSYRKCQCLVSESPLGPFRQLSNEAVTPADWHCLDGTLYEDKQGRPWMVFCHEWLQVGDGQIAAVALSDNLSRAVSEPRILFRASDAPWRGNFCPQGGFVTDGPFLYRMKDGSLLMLWSNFTEKGYATGYAKSASGELSGPWIQRPEPLYFHDGAHSMLFHTFDGRLMMALHCPNDHPKKRMLLFEMEEKDGELAIINEVTGNWYRDAKGSAGPYLYREACAEEICFSARASQEE